MLVQDNEISHKPRKSSIGFISFVLLHTFLDLDLVVGLALTLLWGAQLSCLELDVEFALILEDVDEVLTQRHDELLFECCQGHWLLEGVEEALTVCDSELRIVQLHHAVQSFGRDFMRICQIRILRGLIRRNPGQNQKSFLKSKVFVRDELNSLVFHLLVKLELSNEIFLKSVKLFILIEAHLFK